MGEQDLTAQVDQNTGEQLQNSCREHKPETCSYEVFRTEHRSFRFKRQSFQTAERFNSEAHLRSGLSYVSNSKNNKEQNRTAR